MDMTLNGRSLRAFYGLLLEDCYLSAPVKKRMLVDIPGADGQIDLLEGWGYPVWSTRTVTARFAVCRDAWSTIRRLTNDFEGKTVPIILPGIPEHYMTGTVHISAGSVFDGSKILITAECDPWLYSLEEKVYTIPASDTAVAQNISNRGTRMVVPELTVTGSDAVISLDGEEMTFAPGTYTDGRFAIAPGVTLTLSIQGGEVTIRYREAVLL